MAKFELNVYNEKDEVIKTYQKNKCSVELFIKFQQLSDKLTTEKVKNDAEFFNALKDLFCEFFAELTEKEYTNNTDVAEVILLFNKIITKATQLTNEKNV